MSHQVVDEEIARHLPTVSPYASGIDVSGFSVDDLFPKIDPGFTPFGSRVLVQIRRVVKRTKSGIYLGQDTVDTEAWNMQVGKVIDMGTLAFSNRRTGDVWPEGKWAEVGDFVRFLRHVGDRLSVQPDDGGEPVAVLILNDSDLIGKYTGDPREVRAYLL